MYLSLASRPLGSLLPLLLIAFAACDDAGQPARDAETFSSLYGKVLAKALQPVVADRFQSAPDFWRAMEVD